MDVALIGCSAGQFQRQALIPPLGLTTVCQSCPQYTFILWDGLPGDVFTKKVAEILCWLFAAEYKIEIRQFITSA